MSNRLILKELSRYKVGTYADIVYRNALLYSDDMAFKYGSETLTFSEFNTRVNKLIHALREMGIRKGEVLGVLSWNCMEYLEVYGAAMKGGYIASPFNARLQADELDYLVNYSEAAALFVGPELLDLVASMKPRIPKVRKFISFKGPAPGMVNYHEILEGHHGEEPDVQVEEDDPVFIFYTSGTTGIPRGALYTQGRAMDDTRRLAVGLNLRCGDKQIQIMPLFHVGGTKNLWGYFFVAASNIIIPGISFDPAATLQAIQDERATDIHIVATHLAAFLNLPQVDTYDLSSLKCMFYAASPMPVELLKRGMEKWGPIFVQFYGATEDGPNVTMLSKAQHDILDRPPEEQETLASAGFPHIGVHVRMDTRETIVDGWVHTGDLGRYNDKGFVYIVDRKRDMIISGGENIFPREVEEILYGHPAVQEAAVIGIPDAYWVEKVHAVVVLRKGQTISEKDLIDFCKQKLAHYKAPKSVDFVDVLPKSPAGKILKRQIREHYRTKSDQ